MHVGLSQRVLYHRNRAYDSIEHGWYSFLKEHTLSFIPNRTDQDFNKLASSLDVLILTGGDDSSIRRIVETKLATTMLLLDKPVIGICHGCFMLSSLMGGEITEVDGHMDTEHHIDYNGQKFLVNSYHTLNINIPHKTATVLARDDQGHCEAWIDEKIAGVVWHPERMATPWLPPEIERLIK